MSSCSDSHSVQKQCTFNCCSFSFFLDPISLFREDGAPPYGVTVSVVVVVVVVLGVVLLARG